MTDDVAETGLMPVPRHTAPTAVVEPNWARMRPLLWAVLEARGDANASLGTAEPSAHLGDLLHLVAALEAALGQAVACLGFTEGSTP